MWKRILLLLEPSPCNPGAETPLQPLIHPVSTTRFPLTRFSPGAGLLRNPFFTLSTLRFSRVWVRKDGNLVMETGCTGVPWRKHSLLLQKRLPCNRAAEITIQALTWHSEGLSSKGLSFSEECFFTDTGMSRSPCSSTFRKGGCSGNRCVVVYMLLHASLSYNTTPIHCTPDPLHPPLQSIQTCHFRTTTATTTNNNNDNNNNNINININTN